MQLLRINHEFCLGAAVHADQYWTPLAETGLQADLVPVLASGLPLDLTPDLAQTRRLLSRLTHFLLWERSC
ncbi:MAG: hypothetical protein HC857_16505 [Synechococcales cyanobacterium RU_4_20]|nr:hypothetical protein [Synechococcales cyanobacterium RU_4_20]